MNAEPSQSWRDNEDMEGTGEGYYAPRHAQGHGAARHPHRAPHWPQLLPL